MAGEAEELRTLSALLENVPPNAGPGIAKALEVTSRHIKDEWSKTLDSSADGRLSGVGASVDYDVKAGGIRRSFEAEIGPNLGRGQGPMAGWFEEGAVDGVPASHPGEKAMRHWEPDFEEGLSIAIADALKKGIA